MTAERFAHRRDHFTAADVADEAIRGLPTRPGRLLLAVLTVTLGIGALVATIGFAQTGAHQLASRFDEFASTRVVAAPAEDPETGEPLAALPWDAPERASRLNGVVAAGLIAEVDIRGLGGDIKAVPLNDPDAIPSTETLVIAVSPGTFEVTGTRLAEGTQINAFHQTHAERVAVLGRHVAANLGISRVDNQPALFIGGLSFTVIGLIDDVDQHPELLNAILLPTTTARDWLGLETPGELNLDIALGAGELVADQLPTALNPNQPTGYAITKPATDSVIQTQLASDVDAIFLGLGIIALLIGSLTTATVTSLSVMERRGEIGLRRALGATRVQIAFQFLTECGIIGLIGGLMGAAAGITVVIATCAANGWTPILDLNTVALAIATGLTAGVVSGILPATKAARIEPATALQAGT